MAERGLLPHESNGDARRWVLVHDAYGRTSLASGPDLAPGETVEVMPVQPAGPETVERVARALFEAQVGPWDHGDDYERAPSVELAEIAVAAVGPVGRSEDHDEPLIPVSKVSEDHHRLIAALDEVAGVAMTALNGRAPVGRSCEVTDDDETEQLRDALTAIRDHGKSDEFPCHAIFKGDCGDTMREIARAALDAAEGKAP